jgi:hypothetical protein
MARLSEAEKRELLSAGPSLAADLAKIKKKAGSAFRKPDGSANYASLTSFLNQMNILLGHPRKAFRPIRGDRFLL